MGNWTDLIIIFLFTSSLVVDRYFLFVIIKPDVKNESSTSYFSQRKENNNIVFRYFGSVFCSMHTLIPHIRRNRIWSADANNPSLIIMARNRIIWHGTSRGRWSSPLVQSLIKTVRFLLVATDCSSKWRHHASQRVGWCWHTQTMAFIDSRWISPGGGSPSLSKYNPFWNKGRGRLGEPVANGAHTPYIYIYTYERTKRERQRNVVRYGTFVPSQSIIGRLSSA